MNKKHVPGMDIVNHLLQPLSTERVGYLNRETCSEIH